MDRQTALHHAIQIFPKVSSKAYLPAQLKSFTAILNSHGVPDDQRACQLPGISYWTAGSDIPSTEATKQCPLQRSKS